MLTLSLEKQWLLRQFEFDINMLFQLLLLISSMYGSSNIFARSRQQNSTSNSYNSNRFNSSNSSTNQSQNIGTYRVEYKDGQRPSALMTSINPNWREFPPLSIMTRDKTLHLSSIELRIQDYFLIRNRKLSQSTSRHFDTVLKNQCFNQELLKNECYKLFKYSNERTLDLDALRNGANKNNSPLGSRNGLNSDSNNGSSSQNNNSNSPGGYLGASRFNYSSNNNNTSNNVFSRNSQNDSNSNNNDQYNRNNNTSQGTNIFNSNKQSNSNNQNAYNTRGSANSSNIFSNQANNSNSSSSNIFNNQSKNIFNQTSNSNNNSLTNNNNGHNTTNNNGYSNNNANNANSNQNGNSGNNNNNNGSSNNNNNNSNNNGNNPSNNIFNTKNSSSSGNNQNNQNNNSNSLFNNQNNQLSQSNNSNYSNNINYSNHPLINNMNLNNNSNLNSSMNSANIFGSNPYQLLKSQAMIFNGIIKEIEQRVVERISPAQTTIKFDSFSQSQKNGSFFSLNDPYRDPYFNLSYSKRKKQPDQTIQIFISSQDSTEKEQLYASKVHNSKNSFKNNSFLPLESKIQNNSFSKNNNKFIQINLTKKCQSILIRNFSCDSKCFCSVKFDIRWVDGIYQNQVQIVKEDIELPSLEVNNASSLQYLVSVLKESFPVIRSDAKIILSQKSSIISERQVMLFGTIQQKVINLSQRYYEIFYTSIKKGELHNFTIIKKENGVKTATISWEKPIRYEFLDFSGHNVFNLQLSQVVCNLPQLNSKCRITFSQLPTKIKKIYKQSGKQQAIANLNSFIDKKNHPQKLFTLCSIYNDGSWTLIVQKFN